MAKKRTRRWYISCRQVKKNDYQKMLLDRHQVVFAKNMDEAELVLLPQDHGGITPQQKTDLQRAIDLGINCWLFPAGMLNDHDLSDTLELERMDRDNTASYISDAAAEDDLELAL